MKIETLNDLFALKIMALYDIETVITKALPKMARATDDPDLKQAFEDHLKETKEQAQRLEQIFEMINMKPKKTKVEAIRGLVADTEWVIGEKPSPALLDALLLASARYVEHYEMAGYMTAIAWAKTLGMDEAAELLETTLEEEKMADEKLGKAADSVINERAAEEGGAGNEGEDDTEEDEDELA